MENMELARADAAALPGLHIQTDGIPVDEIAADVLREIGDDL